MVPVFFVVYEIIFMILSACHTTLIAAKISRNPIACPNKTVQSPIIMNSIAMLNISSFVSLFLLYIFILL